MSIEMKIVDHPGNLDHGRTLHRWACLVCSKAGMWVSSIDQATKGMHVHIGTANHKSAVRRGGPKVGRR